MRSFTAFRIYLIAAAAAIVSSVYAGPGEWKTYTSKRNVRAVALDSSRTIWAATSGGLFAYRPAAYGQFLQLNITTSEGLRTTDLTAVAVDNANTVWTGASNGMIHRYNPVRDSWEYINDIASLSTPQKQINGFRAKGDTLYILSAMGVSVYNIARGEFGDTYTRFGAGVSQIAGTVLALEMHGDRIWIATAGGVASTPETNPNPSAPESWRVDNTSAGLPSNNVRSLCSFSGTLFAATANGVGAYNGTAWSALPGTSGKNVVGVSPAATVLQSGTPDRLAILTTNEFLTSPLPGAAGEITGYPAESGNYTALSPFGLVAGTGAKGLTIPVTDPMEQHWEHYLSPGPGSNVFVGMAVDNNGILWSATGSQNGEGFSSFDGTTWRAYNTQLYPQLGSNDFFKVSIGANNAKWIGNWGAGVTLVDGNGEIRKVFTLYNGLRPTLTHDLQFIVVGGVGTDASGNAWITNRTPPNDTTVVIFKSDSTITFATGQPMRTPDIIINDVLIDQYNTKWFANFNRFEPLAGTGLLFYNESGPLPGMTSAWGKLTTSDGLTSNSVWCLTQGRDGDLWVGTDQGISIIFDTQSPRNIALYHPLRDQVVQSIVTDPLNNKWCATKQGVFVMSSDGTTILDHYTRDNTGGKLPDDDVASIAIDGSHGIVYLGTEKGLAALTTPAFTPARAFTELKVSPNPFYIPSQPLVTIDGLVQGTTLKITTVSGTLVREIRSPGGRVGYWDGRDASGDLVASGVYIVVAASEDGSKTATGKIAVLRK